ncbi:MAG: glycoside hydrolase family 95 protein [Defluviitaleaceae bacterium]|nr:glycoside hydrolase family 95 protein [Defluviitaleaceae bacterium]
MRKIYKLWYDKPAPNRGKKASNWPSHWSREKDPDWEAWSLPLGCGYLGANVFGRTDTERIQITDISLSNPYPSGVNNLAEIYIDINHPECEIKNYVRDLVLNDATAHATYEYGGVTYEREYIASYPDGVIAVRFTASQKGRISFTVRAETPYLIPFGKDPYGGDGDMGKTGEVRAGGDTITIIGEMEHFGILYEGQIRVVPEGGKIRAGYDKLFVENADSVVIYITGGTNYEIAEKTYFGDRLERLSGNAHPHGRVSARIESAVAFGYDEVRRRHVADYGKFFDRVYLDIGGKLTETPTDMLLANYKERRYDPYLEEVYFQYGRYLLIASSRKGALPGNLQGVWNQYGIAPWSAGYWHNINIQMNYWPAFTTNLAEMFESYADMNKAFFKIAQGNADKYIAQINLENPDAAYVAPLEEAGHGNNGWAVGTGAGPFYVSGPWPGGHSGPGTSALTAKMFWDYYDYTRDTDILRNMSYPILSGVSRFLSKSVIEKDGFLLVHPSASPEISLQNENGVFAGRHYTTTGCAFDQQMIYENHKDTINAAEILGIEDETVRVAKEQISRFDPIIIGGSGQIKEYREEDEYGEIGDPNHRHISHLKGLFPGQLITSDTPEWVEAAKVTMHRRGDKSTGWAMAFRMLCWARTKSGQRAYELFQSLLKVGTLTNLWDTHPPFQIDGNYGGTAGVAEMLLQSNGNIVEPLPALPPAWGSGAYDGLVARGNLEIGCAWDNGMLTKLTVKPRVSGTFQIRYPRIGSAKIVDANGKIIEKRMCGEDLLIDTVIGGVYTITI